MSIEILNLQLWVDRAKAKASEFNDRVYGAAELEAAINQGAPRQMPSVYLMPGSDQASPNEVDTGLIQRNVSRLSAIIAIRNIADATGSSSHQALRAARKSLMTALLNWMPDEAYDITEFVQGRLVRFQNGVIWWEDIYRTALYLRV